MSDGIVIALIAGAVTGIPTTIGAIWQWSKAVEARAYERARNEALLREANAALAQKDKELDQRDRIITSQQRTIDWLTAEEPS